MKRGILSKAGFKKMTDGHPWLNATDIVDRTILPHRAAAFQLGRRWWLYSPESFLRLRRLGPPQEGWMHNPNFNVMTNADQFFAYFGKWLTEHLAETLLRKSKALGMTVGDKNLQPHEDENLKALEAESPQPQDDLVLRWIFSENDFIPGLILDVFGKSIVAQINSAPIELFWLNIQRAVEAAYQEVTGTKPTITALRNSSIRRKEGLEIIAPELPAENSPHATTQLRWNGLLWNMHPGQQQKTGAYFDQRDNHRRTAELARAKKVQLAWDLCTHEGGFALHLLKEGVRVLALDQSSSALAATQKNVELNQLPLENLTLVEEDVFQWLAEQVRGLEDKVAPAQNPARLDQGHDSKSADRPDMIILDPPSFVKDRQSITTARKGYVELNTLALKALRPKGVLVSCVCSHHMSLKMYEEVLRESATSAGCKIKILEQHGPSPDHAPAPNFPEGHYLQAWFVEKSSSLPH
jgi:23S rRNA (cytosine1962-C5)-methyltransferase